MARLALTRDMVRPIPRAVPSYASMLFPLHQRSAFAWAMPLATAVAVSRLAASGSRTLRFDAVAHFPFSVASDDLEDVRLSMAAERCQVADAGHFYGKIFRKMVGAMVCPFGCMERDGSPAVPSWRHAQFRCKCRVVAARRAEWRKKVERVAEMFRTGAGTRAKAGNPQVQVQYVRQALVDDARGPLLQPLPAVLAKGSHTERHVRAALCGMVDKTGTAGLDTSGPLQRQVALMGALGLVVQLTYRQETMALVEKAHERAVQLRRGARVLLAWRAMIHGGPRRLMALYELRVSRRLALQGVSRMSEERRAAAALSVCAFADRAREQIELRQWGGAQDALRRWGQLYWLTRWRRAVRARGGWRCLMRDGRMVEVPVLSFMLTAALAQAGGAVRWGRRPNGGEAQDKRRAAWALRWWCFGGGHEALAAMGRAAVREARRAAVREREEERRRSAAALATYVARGVVVKLKGLPVHTRYAWGTCSGAIAESWGEQVELDLCPAVGWRRRHRLWAKRREQRARAKRRRREALRLWEWHVRLSGGEPDDRGFWPVDRLLAVRRPERRWGRQLEVLVRWAGGEHEDSWESMTPWRFTADQHRLARRMEAELYGGSQPPVVFRGLRASTRLGGRRGDKRRVVTEGDDGRFVRARVGPRRIADADTEDGGSDSEWGG